MGVALGKRAEHAGTVDHWHQHIEHDSVDIFVLELSQSFLAIQGGQRFIILLKQHA